MANVSAALRKKLQMCSAEELVSIAEAWAVGETPKGGWQSELLGEKLLDTVAARFAWESLSVDAREILHQIILYEVTDGIMREDVQILANLGEASFAAALSQLEQRVMLIEEPPNASVRRRMEERGQEAAFVLVMPKDFRVIFTTIDHEIYGSFGDRTKMQLVDVLATYDIPALQAMVALHQTHGYSLQFHMHDKFGLARSLAGKLVQPATIEVAWEKFDPGAQKLCRWLCRADGSAESAQLCTALELSRTALARHLRQLESYGLVFDTFSGQAHIIFIGRGIFKVLRTFIGEMDQMAEKAKQAPTGIELQEAPPIVHEAHGQLLYDLAIVIGASYQMVIEPTQAGKVPKRLANKISPLLHGSRPAYYENTDSYLDMVFAIAETLDLLELHASTGQKARYMPGSKLDAWGKLQPFEQVCQLLEVWQSSDHRGWSDVAGVNYRPSSYSYSYYMDMHSARTGLLAYLTQECEPGKWYELTPFLQNAKAKNPLLLRENSRYAAYGGMRNRKDVVTNWDHTDGEIIAGMLASTLNELGLVTIGYQTAPTFEDERGLSNPAAFSFTDLAAQVLWHKVLPEENSAGNERARTLIVQPNFELLLLHTDYPTLYQLLPFARVDQVEMVSKLTLTQESVRRGVEAGYGVERALHTLQAHSQKDLPQNVLYTLQDWGRLYKNATISQMILLEVGSESMADEICASSKARTLELRRLGPCAIAVGTQVSLQVLRSTLEKEGVILHIQGDILSARDVASASTYYGRRR